MMQLTQETSSSTYFVQGYEHPNVKISGNEYSTPILISPEKIIENLEIQNLSSISDNLINEIKDLKPEMIIIGTGEKQIFPPAMMLEKFIQTGIGFEIMDNIAACRTYSILSTDHRGVICLLLKDA